MNKSLSILSILIDDIIFINRANIKSSQLTHSLLPYLSMMNNQENSSEKIEYQKGNSLTIDL